MFVKAIYPPIPSRTVGLNLSGVTKEELLKLRDEGYHLFIRAPIA